MVERIAIYVEGGGPDRNLQARLREALDGFLSPVKDRACRQRIGWRTVACGGRRRAYEDFMRAVTSEPGQVLHLLLLDAEGPVAAEPWLHLRDRRGDEMTLLSNALADRCHLMVQSMETWLLVDRENLARFYGPGFNPEALPGHRDVEQIDRHLLSGALEAATRRSRRGAYDKGRHSFTLLRTTDAALVRQAAPHCERLFAHLEGALEQH